MPSNETTTGPALHGIPANNTQRTAVEVPVKDGSHIVAAPMLPSVATGLWRVRMAERLSREPSGLRPVYRPAQRKPAKRKGKPTKPRKAAKQSR